MENPEFLFLEGLPTTTERILGISPGSRETSGDGEMGDVWIKQSTQEYIGFHR